MSTPGKKTALVAIPARVAVAATLIGSRRGLAVHKVIAIGNRFGVDAVQVRKALSRMVSAGQAVNDGRHYSATNKLTERRVGLDLPREAIHCETWNGRWEMLVLRSHEACGSTRGAPHKPMTSAKFVELEYGVWLRPSVGLPTAAKIPSWLRSSATQFDCVPDAPDALADRLWGLRSWSENAAGLLALTESVRIEEAGPDDGLAIALKLRVVTVKHLGREPDVPRVLLPDNWPGARLRSESDRLWSATMRETARLRQSLK